MAAMTAIMLGIGLASSAAGSVEEGRQKASAMKYNARVAENDAKLAEKSKEIEIGKHRTAVRKLLARQNAVIASSGRSYSGSPLDIISRSESEALLDESIIRMNADVRISKLRSQSMLDRGSASAAASLGRAKAARSLAMAAGSFGKKSAADSRNTDRSASESGSGRIVT